MKAIKHLLLFMILIIVLAMVEPAFSSSAKSNVRLSKSKSTLTVGQSTKLTLKGTKRHVKWSYHKKYVSLRKLSNIKVRIKAKKAGKTKIYAKCNKKRYVFNLTIKKKKKITTAATPTPTIEPVLVGLPSSTTQSEDTPASALPEPTEKPDEKLELSIIYGSNCYLNSSGEVVFPSTIEKPRARTTMFSVDKKTRFIVENGIKYSLYMCVGGDQENTIEVTAIWCKHDFVLEEDRQNKYIIKFAKIDVSDILERESLLRTSEDVQGENTSFIEGFHIPKVIIRDDDNLLRCCIQGMCSDGTYLYYKITKLDEEGRDELVKYNLKTGESISVDGEKYGHGNDLTYNKNTGMLYMVDATSSKIYIIRADTLESVETVELSSLVDGGNVASIAYNEKANQYVLVGGIYYTEENNTVGWTYPYIYLVDENFQLIKKFHLENDYNAYQGIDCDGDYIYLAKVDLTTNVRGEYVFIYDMGGNYIDKIECNYFKEIEGIQRVGDVFYLAYANKYYGGYILETIPIKTKGLM